MGRMLVVGLSGGKGGDFLPAGSGGKHNAHLLPADGADAGR